MIYHGGEHVYTYIYTQYLLAMVVEAWLASQ